MRIIVNDTNILIDLANLNLFDYFLNLEFEFHTNDFIINELTDIEQKEIIDKIIEENKLIVAEIKSEEYPAILNLQTKNLSFEDCSIWYYAKKVNGILLTGDARLRKSVEKSGIEVRGILFIFDELVRCNIIDKQTAVEKLKELLKINHRLPKKEIILNRYQNTENNFDSLFSLCRPTNNIKTRACELF